MSKTLDKDHQQPLPKKGDVVIYNLVIDDIMNKADRGKQKYGTYLQSNNGRDALLDAYEEAIDLVMYLKQALVERENVSPEYIKVSDVILEDGIATWWKDLLDENKKVSIRQDPRTGQTIITVK